ncbi:MAG: hypothetical protein E7639_00960 [Ruminococcaceae bacterium]|nr:hypothetical protein [Oscillospiraceae bacterium]
MIKKNKIKALISSLLILLPSLTSLVFWRHINDMMHKSFLGESTHGLLFMTLLPCLLLALHWVMLLVTSADYRKSPQHKKLVGIVFFIVPVISLFVECLFFAIILGWQLRIQLICGLVIGIAMMVIGNYMPKSRPNHTMGVRTRWALNNEENWHATHRFGGKLSVGAGVLFLFAGFLPLPLFIPVLLLLLLPVVLLPNLYSYRFYQKQVAEGTREAQDYKMTTQSKVAAIVTAVAVPLILVLCLVLMNTGDIEVSLGGETLTVKADYYDDLTLTYADIASIAYIENDSALRQYGYGSFRLDMGVYQNEALGTHLRYAYHKCHAAVVITANDGQILVLNGIDETATKELYNKLQEKVGE